MRVLNLILAESSLELVPREIASHPSVINNARRRGKNPVEILLDSSVHYAAMKRLPNREKRGRPDIVHVALLNTQYTPLNLEGRLRTYIHTVSDYVIFVDPAARVPKNYNRFVGLMEQLLTEGRVPPGSEKPLLEAVPMSFEKLITYLKVEGVILMTEAGEITPLKRVCEESLENNLPVVIGGFPHGDFSEEVRAHAVKSYSIYHKPLDTAIVLSKVVTACEHYLKILI